MILLSMFVEICISLLSGHFQQEMGDFLPGGTTAEVNQSFHQDGLVPGGNQKEQVTQQLRRRKHIGQAILGEGAESGVCHCEQV